MRTGAVGNRSAEEMVRTLVEPKKSAVSSIRQKLLAIGYSEEVEYDAVNIEPVLIYSLSVRNVLLVKHKWELCALIPFGEDNVSVFSDEDLLKYEIVDDEKNRWLKFVLPNEEEDVLKILGKL